MLLQDLVNSSGSPFIVQCESGGVSLQKRLQLLGVTAYIVDIGLSRTKYDLFETFRAAMRMPYREIANWDALDEALADLSWLRPNAINIVLAGAAAFSRRDQLSFRALLTLLNVAGEEWARPVTDGEWWDRNAIPFHVYIEREATECLPFAIPALLD
ncbi:barstar family protein [Aliirhizobium smilacinae]|uniref:Barstar family protein n=1 Tax=Aliirhizobium smilacinae TaxID=1395944 RepID=A0A5C4XP46_9HYPH|nr:barstar family protein [Rhizobium smilacinae]TNM65192.1 barstar family protein [Rhizobium smilacinae]